MRPQSTPAGRPHVVTVRFSDAEVEVLDRMRGSTPRAHYLRDLVPQIAREVRDTPLVIGPESPVEEEAHPIVDQPLPRRGSPDS